MEAESLASPVFAAYSAEMTATAANPCLTAGMVGFGMIFDETYRPCFEALARAPLYLPTAGPVAVRLAAAATRTGGRVTRYLRDTGTPPDSFANLVGDQSF